MAYTAAHGLPDVDATHAWTPFTGTAPPVLNQQLTDPATLPWIKLLGLNGVGSADAEDNRAPKTFGAGEIPYPGDKLGVTYVYELEVRAAERHDVRALKTGVVRGFSDNMTDEGLMTVTPYTWPGGAVWTFYARCTAVTPDKTFAHYPRRRAPFRWGITVTLRLSDPFVYTGGVPYSA